VKRGFIIGAVSAVVAAVIAFVLLQDKPLPQAPVPVASVPTPVASTPVMPPDHPPLPTAEAEPGPGGVISGTIALDETIADSIGSTVTVFVIARTGEGKGHPVYAKRLDVGAFPAKFALGASDSMTGEEPSGAVSLEARIDLDGDAMTREPHAPFAKIDVVNVGAQNVRLTLKPRA
jgi:hypothetical protein